ncbi:MAG TPA: DUF5005 domain-containing protein [Pirellulales bacterium]|nr:DUF5005 domain-containing protein [Pirellulales bacterium]
MSPNRIIMLLATALAISVATASLAADDNRFPATPDAAWDAAFTRASGWTGGDVAGTVDLGDGRVLWLFGDSWIGTVAHGRHASGSRMVNNAIAIQAEQPGAKADIRFYWQGGMKDLKAWIAPPADKKKPNGWYWPAGGGCVVPGPGGRPRLVIFLFHIGKQEGKGGIWGFKSLGSTMATVDNIADPVEKWQVRQFDIPFAVAADEGQAAANQKLRKREISWGVAACLNQPNGESASGGWFYIYGVRIDSPLNRQLLLARAKIDAPSQFDAWQFYAGGGKWSAAAADAAPVAEGVAPELSVERLPSGKESSPGQRPAWIMVYSESPLGRKIFARTADRPEGPWSERKAVYSVPELERNRVYFEYAAKGHFCLSGRDALLITYLVNSTDFAAMVGDASIYRPRFIRVPLADIFSPLKDRR